MNASDPIEVAEVSKAKALQHDVEVSKKRHDASQDLTIEPAPVTQISGEGEDEPLDKVYPSEEDLRTLRRVAGHLHWTIFTVAFVELCERFSYYGTTAVCK
jgi:POT family proton-dependent oligopeptide transporter